MDYSISEIILKYQKYFFYGLGFIYLALSSVVVAMWVIEPDNDAFIQWVLIGFIIFSFIKMTELEHDRHLYMFLCCLSLWVYFSFDLLPITIFSLLFAILYYYNLFEDIKVWFRHNKIMW